MRITRDTLQRIMRDTVAGRIRQDRSLMAAYLSGSVLQGEFLLGGAADIDLFFIHTEQVSPEREIIHLTDEVHLDIAHHQHRDYRHPRDLRVNPWLGPALKSCRILYDPGHFLDFTQASIRGQFDRPDHVLERVRKLTESARQTWLSFEGYHAEAGVDEIVNYLRAVENAANSIASLTGPPLTERRFLLNFAGTAKSVGRSGLYAGLLGLLGAPNAEVEVLRLWLPLWQDAYQAISSESAPARLHPARLGYYRLAFTTIIEGKQPQAVLWPLLRSWTQAVSCLPVSHPSRDEWRKALQFLGLLGDGFLERLSALDAYLDMVEETVDDWARRNGE